MVFRHHFSQNLNKTVILILVVFVYVCINYPPRQQHRIYDVIDFQSQHHSYDDVDFQNQQAIFANQRKLRLDGIRGTSILGSLQMYIIPQLSCATAVRVGAVGDGGKWLCNPWRMRGNDCVVYSMGVHGDVSFESELFGIAEGRCAIFCFDQGDQKQSLFSPFMGKFTRAFISATTNAANNEYAIYDLMRMNGHEKVAILKMDIEGSEFGALNAFVRTANISEIASPVCQLLVELHLNKRSSKADWTGLFETLERVGFRMFYKEANMYCSICYEYSYIHLTCFEQYGLNKSAVFSLQFV